MWLPTRGLLPQTNMGHITDPPPTPPQGRGAVRLSHKAYKTYKSYKSYKTYKPSPLRGDCGGLTNMSHITLSLLRGLNVVQASALSGKVPVGWPWCG